MTNKKPITILSAIKTMKWAIVPEWMHTILAIANREFVDKEAVLLSPAVRKESGNISVRDGVAIINIGGVIFPKATLFEDISGGCSVETLALRFGEAIEDKKVKAIVFNIDSPGGDITGIDEFATLVAERKEIKPIIAYVSGMCCSAAYWIASACDNIIAQETTTIGSLGVVASWSDDSEMKKKQGIKDYEVVSSQTPNKRVDLTTDDGQAILRKEIDALADIFIKKVATHRNKSIEYVTENFGQGGTMLAGEAVKVGMIDGIGNLESVINNLNIKGGHYMSELKTKRLASEEMEDDKEKDSKQKSTEDNDEKKEESKKTSKKKAEDDEETSEDEETEDTESKKKSKTNKQAICDAYNRGINDERLRIASIMKIAEMQGMSDIIKKAMLDEPISASDLAIKILTTQKIKKDKLYADLLEESAQIPDFQKVANDDDFSEPDQKKEHIKKTIKKNTGVSHE